MKRYDPTQTDAFMGPRDDGEWVQYDEAAEIEKDYMALASECDGHDCAECVMSVKSLKRQVEELKRGKKEACQAYSALVHFCEIELGWMFFRAEYRIGDNPTESEKNACILREFLATLPTFSTEP